MSIALRQSVVIRRTRRVLRLVAWSVALLLAILLAIIGRGLIVRLLIYGEVGWSHEIAALAVSVFVVAMFFRHRPASRRAVTGAGLLMLAAFSWGITEVAVAIFGTQPPYAFDLGPLTPGTEGEWLTLLVQLEMAWWTVLFAAGLVLLATTRGRGRRAAHGGGLSPASPSAKLERHAGA